MSERPEMITASYVPGGTAEVHESLPGSASNSARSSGPSAADVIFASSKLGPADPLFFCVRGLLVREHAKPGGRVSAQRPRRRWSRCGCASRSLSCGPRRPFLPGPSSGGTRGLITPTTALLWRPSWMVELLLVALRRWMQRAPTRRLCSQVSYYPLTSGMQPCRH